MTWLTIAFERPEFLWLLLILPFVWWMGRTSLSGLGRFRQFMAILIRSAVIVLFVFALAEVQLVRITERLSAYFLLDQSLSVVNSQREKSLDYAAAATRHHRNAVQGDLAGTIVFGSDALLERPLGDSPLDDSRVESAVDPRHTNIASALRLARGTFPEGTAKRVVLVSDGNQNLGDAFAEAQALTNAGIGIDVAILPSLIRADVVVEKIVAPTNIRSGAPFDVSLVLNNIQPQAGSLPNKLPPPISGRAVIMRKNGTSEKLIAEQDVTLEPGKQVFTFRQDLQEPGFYVYEARFIPNKSEEDRIPQNNRATAFTQVRGQGKVLFIVNGESPDDYSHLISRLRAHEVDVTVQTTHGLFTNAVDLQPFDCVVLANVRRTSSDVDDAVVHFSNDQIHMLVQNAGELGAGLVMMGGVDSFGAGGWTNTELERAMPVDFTVKNDEVTAVGALMLVIDKSGSMTGPKLELSKAAAIAAAKMLSARDYVGVIAFDTGAEEVVKLQQIGDRRNFIQSQISRLAEGGGTNMEPGMRTGYSALQKVNASVKHMIVLTDGQTNGDGYEQRAAQNRQKGITTSAIAIGPDAAKGLLQAIANRGGGKFYQVNDPRAIPRVFMRETRRVMRPLIYESETPFAPQMVQDHEVLSGLGSSLPPITGYVLSTAKENPLVEVPLVANEPRGGPNPLLATWSYGLGRTAVFTTDAGKRWATSWQEWENYDQLFVQLIRWSMRPSADRGDFTLAADVVDGKLRVVVNGLTNQGDFLNGLSLQGRVVGEERTAAKGLEFEQVAPGRYIAQTPLEEAGSYFLSVSPGRGYPTLQSGINVPYSHEFKDQSANEQLLTSLASLTPRGGKHGEIIRLPDDPAQWSKFSGPNVFRHDLAYGRTLSTIWHLAILLAGLVFFADVLNRRVLFALPSWETITRYLPLLRRQSNAPTTSAHLERLKTRKALLTQERFTVAPDEGKEQSVEQNQIVIADTPPLAEKRSDATPAEPENQETHSERLLRVKRQLRSNKDHHPPENPAGSS